METNGDLFPQYIAAVVTNILSFTNGMALGWTAPMQPIIEVRSDVGRNLTATGKVSFTVTSEELSWITAVFSISGCIGTPVFGFCANAMGRRKTLLLAAATFLISFMLIAAARSPPALFWARAIGGVAGAGTCVIVPMYLGEIAEVKVRGILGSLFNLFTCSGILASYIIGSYAGHDDSTKYFVLAGSMVTCAFSFFLLAFWLPESPVFCLITGQSKEAFNALLKLRGSKKELVEQEITAMSLSAKEMASNNEKSMGIFGMLRDKATRKALIIVNTLLLIQQASGISPIFTYAVFICNVSGKSQISGAMSAVIVGILMIVGAILGTLLIRKAGRKILLIISSIGMAMTLAPIAYFFYLIRIETEPNTLKMIGWLPVTSLSIYIIAYGLGFGSVPFVLLSEMFKTNIRTVATSTSICFLAIICFLILKFFGNLSDAIGIDSCFAIFSVNCIIGALFTWLFVIETEGKPLEDIIRELEGSQTVDKL